MLPILLLPYSYTVWLKNSDTTLLEILILNAKISLSILKNKYTELLEDNKKMSNLEIL